MKLKVNVDTTNSHFENLSTGDVFKDEDGIYYMKVNDPLRNTKALEITNAVCLASGSLCLFGPSDKVQLIQDYEMQINE